MKNQNFKSDPINLASWFQRFEPWSAMSLDLSLWAEELHRRSTWPKKLHISWDLIVVLQAEAKTLAHSLKLHSRKEL